MIDNASLIALFDHFRLYGFRSEHGLTNAELRAAEERYEIIFPPDLRALLEYGLPLASATGAQFPNWRALDVHDWMDDLRNGILFDVERWFWLNNWPPRPSDPNQAITLAAELLSDIPKLIPIYGHRFMPVDPLAPGNPVLSILRTDVIYYGWDLETYFSNEFAMIPPKVPPLSPAHVEFWSDIVVQNRLGMPSTWAPGP